MVKVKCWSCGKRGEFASLEEALSDEFNFPEPNVVGDEDAEPGVVQCICKACMELQAKGQTAEAASGLPNNDELLKLAIESGKFSDNLQLLDTDDVRKLHIELMRDYHIDAILGYPVHSIVEAVKRMGWQDQLLEE